MDQLLSGGAPQSVPSNFDAENAGNLEDVRRLRGKGDALPPRRPLSFAGGKEEH